MSGVDPVQHRRKQDAEQAATIFKIVAADWLSVKNDISQSYRKKIVSTFAANVYPRIGDLPVQDITPPLLLPP
ncbi:MAG: phage integrase central domain-containing protein [Sulfuricella sp.]